MELKKCFMDVLIIRNLQLNSVKTYECILDHFMKYCQDNTLLPEDFAPGQLNTYIASGQASPAVMRQRIGVIKTVYEFCLHQGFKTYYLPYPKKKKLLPEYLTPYQLTAVFNQVKNKKQRCILKLQYACALRVHEVVKIKRSDFIKKYDAHTQKNVYDLRVTGKGGRMREIPVPDETIAEIFCYWQTLTKKPSEYLFEGQFKQYYSSRSVQIVMKRAMLGAGIHKQGNTHLLRHSRASHLIQAGVDIRFIQQLLGHASIKTTEIYTHFKTSDMRVIFNKADLFVSESVKQESLNPKIQILNSK